MTRPITKKISAIVGLFILSLLLLSLYPPESLEAVFFDEVRLTTNSSNQNRPVISGNRIVWFDLRNGNSDIYLYDLGVDGVFGTGDCDATGRCEGERRITTNTSVQSYPEISKDRIVWQDFRNGNDDIYLYDLGVDGVFGTGDCDATGRCEGERRITTNTSVQMLPAISRDKIVWQDYRNGETDIYLYDLATNQERRITINAAGQSGPDIYWDKIVWQDTRNGFTNRDIFLYDLVTGEERQITTDPADQLYPDVTEDKIVWQDFRNGNWDIYLYDLTTGVERQITTNVADQEYPYISRDKIVWHDYRNGNMNPDIFLYDLTTNEEQRVTTDPSGQFHPYNWGNKIVWQDMRNGNFDVYLATIYAVPPPPTVSISLSSTTVYAGESFGITVGGHSAVGLTAVWWFGNDSARNVSGTVDGVGVASLNRAFWHECGGAKDCLRTWTVVIAAPGEYTFGANSRDILYPVPGESHQASEGSGILYVTVENRPPVIAAIPDQITSVDTTLTLFIEAYDPEGDAITLGANGLPEGSTFDPTIGHFTFRPRGFQKGKVYQVIFEASDGRGTTREEVTISVAHDER